MRNGLIALCLVALFVGCSNVGGGFCGVKRTMGRISNEPLEEGPHLFVPFFQSIEQVDIRLKSFEVESTCSSKDLQVISTHTKVQHSLSPKLAPNGIREIGDVEAFDKTVINPGVLESMKAVTAKYTAEELITRRDVVKQEIEDHIKAFVKQTLVNKGVDGALDIANVSIADFKFSATFDETIEAKVRAQQEVLTAQSNKAKSITDAEAVAAKTQLDAQAAAFKKKQDADASSYQIEKESIQRAAAIEREAKALAMNPNLIQLRGIEKWDGNLPNYVGTGTAMPFLTVVGTPNVPATK